MPYLKFYTTAHLVTSGPIWAGFSVCRPCRTYGL